MVHERHSRCPPYAGARASRQYDTGWYTADAHTDVHERRSRCPHWWCTSDAADAQRYGRCPPYAGARASQH
eukprot:scaffold34084_cov70-Phaeocystis_antarctica.AAC.1